MTKYSAVRGAVVAVLAAAGAFASAAVNVGEHLPAETHLAFWVEDLKEATAHTRANPFVAALTGEGGPLGSDIKAGPRILGSLPRSNADPLSGLWGSLLPISGVSLESAIESANSVFHLKEEDVLGTFSGSLAIYSTLYDLYVENGIPIVEWDVVLAAEYKDSEKEKVD